MGSRRQAPFRPHLLLVLLTLVAAIVRFGDLTAQSFWLDEYLWTRNAAGSVRDILRLGDGYPPLFGLLVHAQLQAGLASDWWLRAPSALAGTLAVPLTYAIGRRVAGYAPALAAAALLAVNPMAIWYSQECGAYALVVLMALASTLCFLRLLAGGGVRDAYGYTGALFLGFGLHYYFVFVVVAQALVATWDAVRRPQRRVFWACMACAAAATLAVWGQAFLCDLGSQSAEDSGRQMSLLALPYTMLTFVGGFSLGPPLRSLHRTLYGDAPLWTVVAPYSVVTVLALGVTTVLAALASTRRWTVSRALTALLVVVPVLGAWLASMLLVGYRPRYAVAALPLAAIWCASALRTRFRPLAGALLIVLASLELAALRQIDDRDYAREDTRAAAAYVTGHDPHATVVLVGAATGSFNRYAGATAYLVTILPHDLDDEASFHARMGGALARGGDVWLLSSRPWTIDPNDRVRAVLDEALAPREEMHFAGVIVRRYVLASTRTAAVAVGAPTHVLP
ncbi:MAG: glycosyltransferase family 39 protein [Deltaproteobacteria bacterium]|nr:glycosyltransferase family 39 protein [Deltaproteobacteria bacterium]